MPLLRRRPLLRGAVVGGAAYKIGKNRANSQRDEEDQNAAINDLQNQNQNQNASSQQQVQDEDPSMAKLSQLKKMHDSGVLTDDEFTQAKEKVLASL